MDAFFARAERSSGVRFLADALPPCRPYARAISAIAARTSAEIFNLSAWAFKFGDRGGSLTDFTPVSPSNSAL